MESSFHERCAPLHGKLFRHTDRPTCYCVTRANGCASPLLAAPDRAICGNDPVPPAAPGRHQFFPVIYFPTGSNNWPLRKVRHYQKALRVPIFLNDIQINICGAQKGAAPAQSDYVKPEIQSTYGQLRTAILVPEKKASSGQVSDGRRLWRKSSAACFQVAYWPIRPTYGGRVLLRPIDTIRLTLSLSSRVGLLIQSWPITRSCAPSLSSG